MKGYLIKFIAYVCVTGLALGIKPEDIAVLIKKDCQRPLTIEEKQALEDQAFPKESNSIKFGIIRHLLNRNHFYFLPHPTPEPRSLIESKTAIDAIEQKNNSNVTTYEFLNVSDNEQDDSDYAQGLKILEAKIQDSDKKIKDLENKINSLNSKLKNEKYPLWGKARIINSAPVNEALEILKNNDISLMKGLGITAIVPDCIQENWGQVPSLILENKKGLFHSFCHLEEVLIEKVKDIFLNPLDICLTFRENNEITLVLKSEKSSFGARLNEDAPEYFNIYSLKQNQFFVIKLQSIDSYYRISTIFPMLEGMVSTLEPAFSTPHRISNIHGITEFLLSQDKDILIEEEFLFEDIVDSALKHFNTILHFYILINANQIASNAYVHRDIFEQTLTTKDRTEKNRQYKQLIGKQKKNIDSLIKNKKSTTSLFTQIWNNVFEPQKILIEVCRFWYYNSLTTTRLPWSIEPNCLGSICLADQIYTDLFNDVKIVVEYVRPISSNGKTIGNQFIICIVPQNRMYAKYLSGDQEESCIWVTLELYGGNEKGGMHVSAYPIPKSHLPNVLKKLISPSKLQGNLVDLLSNLKREDISIAHVTVGAVMGKNDFQKNIDACYPFFSEGELIRNEILASLRGMRYVVYQGESDFVENEDQQKLKECQRALRELLSIHNSRVQKRKMLLKMLKERKVKDKQVKVKFIQEIIASNYGLLNDINKINEGLNTSIMAWQEESDNCQQNLIEENCFEQYPPRLKITIMVFNGNTEDQIAITDDFFTQEIKSVNYVGPHEIIPGANYFDIEFNTPFLMFDCNRNKKYNDIVLSYTVRVIVLPTKEEKGLKIISAYPISDEKTISICELKERGKFIKKAIEENEFLVPSESPQQSTL